MKRFLFGKPESDRDYFVLIVLFFIAVAFWASFFKYFINLDYNIYVTVECDPESASCVMDGEWYYNRFLGKAATIEDFCGEQQDDACIMRMYEVGMIEKIPCDEGLEEWESCAPVDREEDAMPEAPAVDIEEKETPDGE